MVASIQGYKTNHSLCATVTSTLYQSSVDEQLVIEHTGHRSLEGVRSYKRTSSEQLEALSDILNRPNNFINKVGHTTSYQNSSSLSTTATAIHMDTPQTYLSSSAQHRTLSLPSTIFTQCSVNFYISQSPKAEVSKRKRKAYIIDSDSDSD